MRKMGTFRGIPVYILQYSQEYQAIGSSEEKLYVCEGKLFYHGVKLADVHSGQLFDFDEDKFNELRRKSWGEEEGELLEKVAETRPCEEEEPVLSDAERVAAQNDIAGQFMLEWRDNIDKEIAIMKAQTNDIGRELNAID